MQRHWHSDCAAFIRSRLHDHVAAFLTHRRETMLFHYADYFLAGE
jgi:hypothetical protein